ncbi:MAG: hypothetical protein P8Z74_19175 [Acidobacteriota bacterium]
MEHIKTQQEGQDRSPRKVYRTPDLTLYGTVRRITLGSGQQASDPGNHGKTLHGSPTGP